MRLLVTGGAGFIGSAFARLALRENWATRLTVLDKLTYAGNLENLAAVEGEARLAFRRGDVAEAADVDAAFAAAEPEAVVHFAAESHVDRSIRSAAPFFETNLRGTFTLLERARAWPGLRRFLHVSTDEVYGSLEEPLAADENFPLRASSPYSASKAGSDLLALSYHATHGLPVVVTRASNNYGPFQFPEKLVPLMVCNALEGRPLPVYGDGRQVRDWLHVEDHCRGVWAALTAGRDGEVYNVGGTCSLENREVVRRIVAATGADPALVTRVADRPGHDRRYALRSDKLEGETGWRPLVPFDRGLEQTVAWYRDHLDGWVARVRSGDYRRYYEETYGGR